ncbi:MAG: FadR/GntR family transcriptional regulator [Anaerolineales bacterium]
MAVLPIDSEFLQYLVGNGHLPGERLPSLAELSDRLDVSVSKLREQLEVARVLGLVDVKPRAGIRANAYTFHPAVRASLLCAIGLDRGKFDAFSELRNRVEASFLHAAIAVLQLDDVRELRNLIDRAQAKLQGNPIQIPHGEHRSLHLGIFCRLANPFVTGLLEAYWDAYEAVELNHFAEYGYLCEVWEYHARIVECIERGDSDGALLALEEHFKLLRHRPDLAA